MMDAILKGCTMLLGSRWERDRPREGEGIQDRPQTDE